MMEMALARLRQLAAHEVGHTLGLMHNYSASTVNRSSVMDYPPPLVKLAADGTFPIFPTRTPTGIGDWDKVSITWGYSDFAPGTDEHAALDKILSDAFGRGPSLSHRPGRPPRWFFQQRRASLGQRFECRRRTEPPHAGSRGRAARFGENNIREGAPLATLEDVLVPVYMFHRYQVEAASKLVGGMDYTFALRGDGEVPTQIVAPAEQRRALAAVLATLKPEALALPESLLKIIPPRPPEYPRDREDCSRFTPVLHLTRSLPRNPRPSIRCNFCLIRNAPRASSSSTRATPKIPASRRCSTPFSTPPGKRRTAKGYHGEIANTVDNVVLYDLMALSANDHATRRSPRHRFAQASRTSRLARRADPEAASVIPDKAHIFFAASSKLSCFEKNPKRLI